MSISGSSTGGANEDPVLHADLDELSFVPHQVALTLVAHVRPGEAKSLQELLKTMGDGVANGSVVDSRRARRRPLRALHRPRRGDRPQRRAAARVAPLHVRPRRLARAASRPARRPGRRGPRPALRSLRGLSRAERTRETRLDYLRRHRVKEQAYYVNTVGRTRRRSEGGRAARPARGLRRRRRRPGGGGPGRDPALVREHVEADRSLELGARPAGGPRPRLPAARARASARRARC